jgi:sodium transport system permease protein
VLRKELLDAVRDRRSLLSALVFPLMGPLLVVGMFQIIVEQQKARGVVEVPTIGADHGAALVHFLERHGVDVVPFEGDEAAAREAVREGERELVLVIDADFRRSVADGKPAEVTMIFDGTRNDTAATRRRVDGLLDGFSGELGGLRLIARGVHPEVVRGLDVEEDDVASERELAARLLNFIPMFVVLAAFIGGMNVAVDATAGERERKSLEPLLSTPVSRLALVVGKWLAATVFAAACVLLTFAAVTAAMGFVDLRSLGFRFELGAAESLAILAAALPVTALATGLQLLIGTFARTFKEAQTYLGLFMFLPTLPAVLLTVMPVDSTGWIALVPVLGQQLVLTDALGGIIAPPLTFAVLGAGSVLIGLSGVVVTARLFTREAIVFGG